MDFFDQNKICVIQMSPIDSNSNTYYNQFSLEDRLKYLNNINNIKKLYEIKSVNQTLEKDKFLSSFLTAI